MRFLLTLILAVALVAGASAQGKKGRTSDSVKKEQSSLKRKIGQTQKEIDDNKAKTRRQLNQLNSLNSEIEQTSAKINTLNADIAAISKKERAITDSITRLEGQIDTLSQQCARSLRDSRKRRQSMTELSLIFSSSSFNQALKRTGYIHQLNKMLTKKSNELKRLQAVLSDKRNELVVIKEQQSNLLASLETENKRLNAQKAQTQTLVNDLNQRYEALQAVLKDQQDKAKRLDDELNRIIAEEIRRAEEERIAQEKRIAQEQRKAEEQRLAQERKKEEERLLAEKNNAKQKDKDKKKDKDNKKDKKKDKDLVENSATTTKKQETPKPAPATTSQSAPKLNGSFASNKGKLLFPVAGKYKIVNTFGIHTHESLPYVHTESTGIDIEAAPGAKARAAFDGVVSYIFTASGYNNVVMLRHGQYITVYANLAALDVKKGDQVKAGQVLGQIYSDTADSNRTILHFEVRNEKQKLNPLEWVGR